MTPEEVALVRTDAATLRRAAGEVSAEFYETLFELDPSLRALFPDDLAQQRRKFVVELDTMVELATSMFELGHDRFASQAAALGRRHDAYGTTADHYRIAGEALLGTMETTVAHWNDDHALAWEKLYRLVSSAMQFGHETERPSDAG